MFLSGNGVGVGRQVLSRSRKVTGLIIALALCALVAASARAQTSNPWFAGQTLPTGLGRYGFAQHGSDFYVLGGVTPAGVSNALLHYDAVNDTWSSLADIPTVAGEAACAAYFNGRIYFVDGYGDGVADQNRVRIYDIASNSWSLGPIRPTGFNNSYGAAAAAYAGKVFVVSGGFDPNTTLSIYDIASNTWTNGPAAPAAYQLGGYTQIGQFFYLVGSATTDAAVNSTVTMRFDMGAMKWSTGPSFTSQRADFALAAAGTKLFAIGGDNNGGDTFDNPSAAVDELQTNNWPAGSWVSSPDLLPVARQSNQAGFFSTARLNGEIWSTAGSSGAGARFRNDHIYRAAPPGPPAILLNISTRAHIETGDHVLIGGFILGGPVPKKVIVRGIGPSLSNYGIANPLQNPIIQLYSGSTPIATNDNWQDPDGAGITATGLQPSDPRESAIVATLNPGAYTVIESGVQGGQGIGLVEVYDLEPASSTTLANISTRGVVEGGDNVMIGGVIIGGSSPGRFVVRGIGPSLANYGIADPLPNPVLELHNSNGDTVASNDDWQSDPQAAELQPLGLAPSNNLEAALVRILAPGSYTAIVRSATSSSSGVALVEIYIE